MCASAWLSHRELLLKVHECESPIDTQLKWLFAKGSTSVTWEAVDAASLGLTPNGRAWPANDSSHSLGIIVQEGW